jgi:RTX calcium-binding nonapeptide repeat (4 copies)
LNSGQQRPSRSGRILLACCLIATAAGLPAATAPAQAGGGSGLEFELRFTTQSPGSSTGIFGRVVHADYDGKPKPQDRVIVTLPDGTRIDEAAVAACDAGDDELFTQGASACPSETRVGSASGSVVTGFGPPIDPISGEGEMFHSPGGFVTPFTPPGGGPVLLVARTRIEGRKLIDVVAEGNPPFAPGGPPDGQTVGKSGTRTFEPRSSGSGPGRHDLITTPPDCPSSGVWVSELEVVYQDGTADTARSATPCQPEGKGPSSSCKGERASIVAEAGSPTTGTRGRDVIVGTAGDDRIRSGAGRDLVCGRKGKDRVGSAQGSDRLEGGAGKDRLRAGRGADRLDGGRGRDRCRGGPGADVETSC